MLANNGPDVHLSTILASSNFSIGSNARLSFLAIVDLGHIPLYIAAGPSLEVYTDNESAADWFSDILLSYDVEESSNGVTSEPWWLGSTKQSQCGILLKIEDERIGEHYGPRATEIVLYAALEPSGSNMPTPPASSSPAPPDHEPPQSLRSSKENLKLYALPLCSDLVRRAQEFSGLCSPPPEPEGHACFITEITVKENKGVKRQKMASLFDDATKEKRKFKGRGGESVAQAMANIDRPASLLSQLRRASQEQTQVVALPRRNTLSRASTTSSLPLDRSRPASRSSTLAQGKGSSLHRVESVFSKSECPVASDSGMIFIEQNKAALGKVIMAGMRLHGLQQKKKPGKDASRSGLSRSISLLAGTGVNHLSDEDEFKIVYHQTYKAALFAFRSYCNIRVISQEAMRNVVDQLLDIFSTDPVSSSLRDDGFSQGFASQQQDCYGTFNHSSSSVSQGAAEDGWNTPKVKKRKTGYFHSPEPG
ncbi:MAG: hypothetical protein Q9164_005096 [Protoblastenia rupestris]